MQKLNDVKQTNVVGGIGYRWECSTCGYKSAWHFFKDTAQANAKEHTSMYPRHNTRIISG